MESSAAPARRIPPILTRDGHDSLAGEEAPGQAITGAAADALSLLGKITDISASR